MAVKQPKIAKGAPRPRRAVVGMAPYSPPTGGRAGKLRLDFNENTIGCSPRIVEFLKEQLSAETLAVYPDYGQARPALAEFFQVHPDELLLTNGTDEAIQVLVNTYIDDGGEVLLLHPSYAMYRFYAEVAGASIREIPYRGETLQFPLEEMLEAITPETRAVLIANPNNPTGTAVSIEGVKKILRRARKAAVLIDEAYYEFCGISALGLIGEYPNLFVSRTFSKVYGMAAMRMGCLFSQAANVAYLHKAQSPYSVNALAALAAQEAVRDTEYVRNYVAEALAARELLCVGLELMGVEYIPSQGNFMLMRVGGRSIEIRDKLREKQVLVRDRSYEIPGCVRVTTGTREQTRRFLEEPGKDLVMAERILVFDMDGVLVDVSESYRETIQQTVEHFTGKRVTREGIQDWKNRGGWNDDWALSTAMIHAAGVEAGYDDVVRYFQGLFHGDGSDGLILRERWIAREGLFERLSERFRLAVFTGRSRWEAELTLNRFAPALRFDPIVGSGDVPNHKPAPDGLLHIGRLAPDAELWYVGDTVDDARSAKAAGLPFIGIAARTSEWRDELAELLHAEGARAVLDDINQLEEALTP